MNWCGRGLELGEREIANTIRSSGDGHVGDQMGYVLTSQPSVVSVLGDHTHTLTAEGHDASEDGTGRGTPDIAFAHTAGLAIQHPTSVAPTLKAGHDSMPSVVYSPDHSPALTTRAGNTQDDQQTGQLVAFAGPEVIVRRLTPMECERLQGYPDHWTEAQADSQRYKQLGNSVAVPVFEWVGRRLIAVDNHLTTPALRGALR